MINTKDSSSSFFGLHLTKVLFTFVTMFALVFPSISIAYHGGQCGGVCDEWEDELECYYFMLDPCDFDLY